MMRTCIFFFMVISSMSAEAWFTGCKPEGTQTVPGAYKVWTHSNYQYHTCEV